MSKSKIKPELPGGFRDYLPEDMIARQWVLDTVKSVFERFGFDPLDTPAIEKLEVLTGNNEFFKMLLFRTGIVQGLNDPQVDSFQELALRFDLTVPLARVMAANPDLPKPFKRYQVGNVYRGEKQQAGRFREFMQFDIDSVGVSSMLADTEIIQMMYETLKALGLDDFVISFNNRKVLNGLAELAGFAEPVEKTKEVFRILDKLDKVGLAEVKKELQRAPDNYLDTSAPNLSEKNIALIEKFLNIKGSHAEILSALQDMFKDILIGQTGTNELAKIVGYLETLDIPAKNWQVDLAIARGLDYYTGPVFEARLTKLPEIGSVFGGGRYDGLVSRFIKDAKFPATGVSLGVDRLFVALKKLGKLEERKTSTQVLITNFDLSLLSDYLSLAQELRRVGVNTEIYMGEETSFQAQLAYALKKEIPFLTIIGPEEKEKGIVAVKDLAKREQQEFKTDEAYQHISHLVRTIKTRR